MTTPQPDPWDESLRAAHACGEVIVVRGDYGAFEMDVVALASDADDPYGDACRRAFPAEDSGVVAG